MELKDLTHDHFAVHTGELFQLTREGGDHVSLELKEAKHLPGDKVGSAYSVLFRGPPEPLLDQRMYDITHPDLGTFPIFLVPIASDAKGMVYEAVFTRVPSD